MRRSIPAKKGPPCPSEPRLRACVEVLHGQLAGTDVHATSITITATIGGAPHFEPAEIAEAYLELDNQAETEWQHELVY